LYRPHREVGGDYYDVFPVNANVLAFCMADVSGKGISAAFVMSNFQANVRTAFQFGGTDLEVAVRGLNARVMESARGEKYITLFIALYDRTTRRMRYVNSGHNPPLLMLPDGTAHGLHFGSVGLGMFPELPSIEVGDVEIPRGSVLVCYTDGLVEQEDAEGIPFGNTRLETAVRERRGMGAAAIQEGVLAGLEAFRGATPAFDDTALLTAAFR
jgi:sigma-B regulation protein RsbU (phosphoserine phosphatase)